MDEQKTFSGLPPSFATNIFDGCEEVIIKKKKPSKRRKPCLGEGVFQL